MSVKAFIFVLQKKAALELKAAFCFYKSVDLFF